MILHDDLHPFAGQTVTIRESGDQYLIEDWFDRVCGFRWLTGGNPAAIQYALRLTHKAPHDVPLDDEVLYGKLNGIGHLVHVTEIEWCAA